MSHQEPHDDGRGRQPGEHPEVRRSGRSRNTVIGLVVVLIIAAMVYIAVWAGVLGGG